MPAGRPRFKRDFDGNPPSPGSQSALRQRNQQRVISVLTGGPQTQAELARQTGLSTATVSNIVRAMVDVGLATTAPTTSSGRRALSVILNDNGSLAVGIDVGRRHVRVVLAGLNYQVMQDEAVALPLGHCAREGLDAAERLLDQLLLRAGASRAAVLGAGVGIPGPIDRRTGTVVQGAILPEWVGINILATFGERLGFPVFIDNDANLGALAQVTWGPHGSVENLMFLKVGSGIGAGLILGGSVYYGHVGITGELGHSTIVEHGLVCRCGNRGCLETVASTSTMVDLLSRRAEGPITVDGLVNLALAGDTAALRVIDDAGLALGKAVAHVANLINPELVVIGGPLTSLGDILLEPIRRGLLRHAVPVVGESTAVLMSALGDRTEALGGAAVVLSQPHLHNV
ncbi:ROK family transcriptional regulator [Arthrobacter sp. TMN-50]